MDLHNTDSLLAFLKHFFHLRSKERQSGSNEVELLSSWRVPMVHFGSVLVGQGTFCLLLCDYGLCLLAGQEGEQLSFFSSSAVTVRIKWATSAGVCCAVLAVFWWIAFISLWLLPAQMQTGSWLTETSVTQGDVQTWWVVQSTCCPWALFFPSGTLWWRWHPYSQGP